MKKSYAMKWIKALRSGKYKQAQGSLKTENGHCCLGVLCTLTSYKNNYTKMDDFLGNANETLPEKVITETGMLSSGGSLGKGKSSLAGINDDGASFEEIADIIEKHWKNL